MSKKKFFLLIIFLLFSINSEAKQLTNNVIVSIDNSIITELDINKEINFVKFINKDQTTDNPELIKKEIINSLIDRKIKDIETNYYKIEVSEKEIENNLYNYLERIKINNETLNSFYNQNEIEKDYLKNIIKIDFDIKIDDIRIAYWKEGIHYFKPQKDIKLKNLVKNLSQPHDNFYVCGEMLSFKQGWVEGCIESVNRLITLIK